MLFLCCSSPIPLSDDCDDDDDEDELSAAISAQVAPSFTPVASFKMVYVSPTELRQLINKEAELLPNQVDEVHAQLGEMYADRDSKGWTQAEDELWEEVEEIRGLAKHPAQFQWEYWKLREVDPTMRKLKREFNFLSLLALTVFAIILAMCVDSLKEVIYIYI